MLILLCCILLTFTYVVTTLTHSILYIINDDYPGSQYQQHPNHILSFRFINQPSLEEEKKKLTWITTSRTEKLVLCDIAYSVMTSLYYKCCYVHDFGGKITTWRISDGVWNEDSSQPQTSGSFLWFVIWTTFFIVKATRLIPIMSTSCENNSDIHIWLAAWKKTQQIKFKYQSYMVNAA